MPRTVMLTGRAGILRAGSSQYRRRSDLLNWMNPSNHLAAAHTSSAVVAPLMGTGNYGATSNNMKLVHWPLMGALGGLLHLVQRGGD